MKIAELDKELENKNLRLFDFDERSRICIYKNENEFVVSFVTNTDGNIGLQDSNYYENLLEAANTFENRKINLSNLSEDEKKTVLKEEIKKIELNINNIENSLERIDRIIETFSPNLFGNNGYLDELRELEKTENDLLEKTTYRENELRTLCDYSMNSFEEKSTKDKELQDLLKEKNIVTESINKLINDIKSTIGVDLKEIRNSQDIINKAKEIHQLTNEQLTIYKNSLSSAVKEYESLAEKTSNLFEAPVAADNLRALIAAENKSQNLEQ
jgi:hypothetical protein